MQQDRDCSRPMKNFLKPAATRAGFGLMQLVQAYQIIGP
jgi:hypothetical protein